MDRIDRLANLGERELAALLRRRPDVLVGRPPRTLAELGQRLGSPASVMHAVESLDVARLQVLAAVAALGDGVPVARLAALTSVDPLVHLRDLERLDLIALDLDVVRIEVTVRDMVPDLLALGRPFAVFAEVFPHRSLQQAEAALGLKRSSSKRASVEALQTFYSDAERVRAIAGRLPELLVQDLLQHAGRRSADLLDDGDSDDGFDDFDDFGVFDSRRWQREQNLDHVGLETGLMLGTEGYGASQVFMPSEVALALRGEAYRITLQTEPPPVAWLPVSRIESDAAAAAAGFDSAATAVLDQVAAKPVAAVQAGGVGRRELQRLAKATSVDVPTVMLVLELAHAAQLIDATRPVVVSDAYPAWRDAEPVERFAVLATEWWNLGGRATEDRDPDGTARRALTVAPCDGCRLSRHTLLRVLRPDAGLSAVDADALAGWHAPGAHMGRPPLEIDWREAVTVGALAQGALTSIGAALVAGDGEALRLAAAVALPTSSDEAVFGSDLTVYVAGSPSSSVSALLDACATRESGGGAVTWRLSAATVRRALDDGHDLADLQKSLRAIAAGGVLPQTVEVLLDDVGRVYGRARVRAASGLVVSDDEALLVQMLHDRKLAKLGFEQVAPTVLAATADAPATVKTLRAAGYLPAWTADAAAVDPLPTARSRTVRVARAAPADPEAVARRLLEAGRERPRASATEHMVRDCNPHLSDDEVVVFAAALDHHERVLIVYESSTGGITERIVRPAAVAMGRIWAWCELRHDDREFAIERVLGVRGV